MTIFHAEDVRALAPQASVLEKAEPPVTRVQIAWYMVASYDLNPIHVDEPFAREAGFPSVIGQGMLPLGFLARDLAALVGARRLRRLRGDFVGSVMPGDELRLEIRLGSWREADGGVEAQWTLLASGIDGKPRVRGEAHTWHESRVSPASGQA